MIISVYFDDHVLASYLLQLLAEQSAYLEEFRPLIRLLRPALPDDLRDGRVAESDELVAVHARDVVRADDALAVCCVHVVRRDVYRVTLLRFHEGLANFEGLFGYFLHW